LAAAIATNRRTATTVEWAARAGLAASTDSVTAGTRARSAIALTGNTVLPGGAGAVAARTRANRAVCGATRTAFAHIAKSVAAAWEQGGVAATVAVEIEAVGVRCEKARGAIVAEVTIRVCAHPRIAIIAVDRVVCTVAVVVGIAKIAD